MPRYSSYSAFIFFSLSGFLPEIVSPAHSTKLGAGLISCTACTTLPSVFGCGLPLLAGRLSPATTNTKESGSGGAPRPPVPGSGASGGKPSAKAGRVRKKATTRARLALIMDLPTSGQERFGTVAFLRSGRSQNHRDRP